MKIANSFSCSKNGIGKRTNEDRCFRDDDLGLYILCDGSSVGQGDWAAETVCERISNIIKRNIKLIQDYNKTPSPNLRKSLQELLDNAIQDASAFVYSEKKKDIKKGHAITTLDLLLVLKDSFLIAHAGNGRIYLLRNQTVFPLTEDDTSFAKIAKQGGKLDVSFKKSLLRGIGLESILTVPVKDRALLPGDSFILCSDGLYDALDTPDQGADHLKKVFLEKSKDPNLEKFATDLVHFSVARGIPDDASVIIVSNTQKPSASNDLKVQIELVRKIPTFKYITSDEARLLEMHRIFKEYTYKKGTPIVEQNQNSDAFFIILSGEANIIIDGNQQNTKRKSGDLIGELGFFTGEPRSATVIPTVDTRVIAIQKQDFEAAIAKDKEMGLRVYKGVVAELRKKLLSKKT